MARHLTQPHFDPRAGHEARRPFRFNGRSYRPGDSFPVMDGVRDTRRARQLYERRFIRRSESAPEPEPTPATARVEDAGNGWFNVVDASGSQVNDKKLRRQAAEELAASLDAGVRVVETDAPGWFDVVHPVEGRKNSTPLRREAADELAEVS